MRKKLVLLGALLLLLFPVMVNAAKSNEGYKSMNLKEVFEQEEIEMSDSSYKETDKQVVIYMFRGNGCGYCRAFLSHLNDILKDKGYMFKLQAYEVWGDKNNSKLMAEVAKFTGEDAGGVPYIIIGEKVFPGYIADWDEEIDKAIEEEYKKKEKDRYDVFKEMDKAAKGDGADTKKIIYWTVGSIGVAVIILIVLNMISNKKLNNRFDDVYDALKIERKLSNKEVKELEKEEEPKKEESKTKTKKKK